MDLMRETLFEICSLSLIDDLQQTRRARVCPFKILLSYAKKPKSMRKKKKKKKKKKAGEEESRKRRKKRKKKK